MAAKEESVKGQSVYLARPGFENTDEVFAIARKRAKELDIKTILVASTAVSHPANYKEPNTQEFSEENRKKFEAKGRILVTAGLPFRGGAGAAMRKKFNLRTEADIMADTLRIFGQGMKVVVEIGVMAADAGVVRVDESVIAIAGTGKGADTCIVLKPAASMDFFDTRVQEVVCKPRL
jgi:hypothetical protein